MNLRYLLLALLALALVVGTACGGRKPSVRQRLPQEAATKAPSTPTGTAGGTGPTAATVALERGLQAHRAGDLDKAGAAYREVLVSDPQNRYAFFNLGLIDQTLNRAAAAEANYRLALKADPDFPAALFNLAILRMNAGSAQEAIDLYRHVIAVEQGNAGAHLSLGLALLDLGQTAEAQEQLAQAIKLDPSLGQRAPAAATPGPTTSLTPVPTR